MDMNSIEPGFLRIGFDDLQVIECAEFLKLVR